jgi:SAM-dependent methyltransferase
MDVEWYRHFFHGIALELWRKAIAPEQTRKEAAFLAAELRLAPGARVLDVPCGSGRHAIEIARLGCRVTGVDLSKEQIASARELGAAAGVEIEWRHADMRELPWRSEFDGAFCMGNSFAYLEPHATREFVRALSRSLRSGARVALDTGIAAESILPNFREHESLQVDDILFVEHNRYHLETSCIETAYTFARGAERDTRVGLQWVYTLREIRELFASEGLDVEALYKSIEREPFTLGANYLIVIAEKRR